MMAIIGPQPLKRPAITGAMHSSSDRAQFSYSPQFAPFWYLATDNYHISIRDLYFFVIVIVFRGTQPFHESVCCSTRRLDSICV